MTTPTQGEHAQPEALQDFEVRKLAAIGAVSTSSGLVERRPIEYRRELEDQFVRGFRAAEKRLAAQVAALTAAPQGGAYAPYKQALWSKNCMQCCVSYMLGLPLNSVPDFATDGGWELFSEFVDSKGYAAVMLPGNHEFEADYLASGTTARGTSHMVVMNDGKLVHDPHPSNSGLLEVQCVWLLAKRASPTSGQQDEHAAFEASAKAYTSNVSFARDGDDYEDMTASLLWHGWKLRASHGQAPAGNWLWSKLMYFCKKRGYAPAEYDDLFAIVKEARATADSVPKASFDDLKVQTVYAILCEDAEPPKGEHWEGFAARRIVDALSADSVLEDASRWRELREQHEGDAASCCVFAPNDMHECLAPVGSLPGELDAFMDAERAARKQGANLD